MKEKSKNTAKAVGAVALAAAMLVGGAVAGWYANEGNWFGGTSGEETANTGGLIVSDSPENNGINVTATRLSAEEAADAGVSALAETSYTLTATVTPEEASNKQVDWYASWANGSSNWASGKTVTDYVTVTPTSDGANTATVACIQSFGEQVIVTCASREDPSINGTCTADYEKKVVDVTAVMKKDGSEVSVVDWSYNGYSYTWDYTVVYSNYTIDVEYEVTHLMHVTSEFYNEIKDAAPIIGSSMDGPWSTGINSDKSALKYTTSQQGAYDACGFTPDRLTANVYKNAFSNAESSVFELAVYVRKSTESAGGPYKTFEYGNGTCDFTTNVESVTINGEGIVF